MGKKLHKIFNTGKEISSSNFLDTLIAQRITWHCGGMSDPFQPIENKLHITRNLIDVCSEYGISILFSTKSNTVYDCNINPQIHTFQMSITNVDNLKSIEPNIPDIQERINFYKYLKKNGFRVGIRIQPFIPNISTLEIVKAFEDTDNFTLEGIKIVPQNQEHKKYILDTLNLNKEDFTQMGLLNLKSKIRVEMYRPFIEYFQSHNIPYSIADNDLHYLGTNNCCCGDRLVNKATTFNNTFMLHNYGLGYSKDDVISELQSNECTNCVCNQLFTSNRQEGCKTVADFYDKRFHRKSSPFSPEFQYKM